MSLESFCVLFYEKYLPQDEIFFRTEIRNSYCYVKTIVLRLYTFTLTNRTWYRYLCVSEHSWYSYCPWAVRPYQCLNCPHSYAKKCHLKRHVISACNGKEPRYKCPYCMYISRYPSDTYKHVKRLHEDQQVFAIDVLRTSNYYSKDNEVSLKQPKLNE